MRRSYVAVLSLAAFLCCMIVGVPALAGGVGAVIYMNRPAATATPLPPIVAGQPPADAIAALAGWKYRTRLLVTRYEDGAAIIEHEVGFALNTEDVILVTGSDALALAPLVFDVPGVQALDVRALTPQGTREMRIRISRATFQAGDLSWRDLRRRLTGPDDAVAVSATLATAWQRSQRE